MSLSEIDILKPNLVPRLVNLNLILGTPISPLQKLSVMEDREFEEIILEWVAEYLSSKYEKVKRCAGAGDMGRDIIGIINSQTNEWDNYQCKHYNQPLTPTDFYVEAGKLCYYTFNSSFTIPKKYFILASSGVGSKLGDMLANPVMFRNELIKNWETYVQNKITKKKTVPLVDPLKNYIGNFDFSIIESIEPHEFLKQHQSTSYYAYHFGGGLKKTRNPEVIPSISDIDYQMRYIQQLLDVYSEEINIKISTITDLSKYQDYKIHFELQRKSFYAIETLKQFERDNLPPDSTAFEDFKDDALNAIFPKIFDEYKNSFNRINQILCHISKIEFTSNPLVVVINITDKQGICHHLVNENKISWITN